MSGRVLYYYILEKFITVKYFFSQIIVKNLKMSQSTLNIEKKIYRQIVKGIGYYQNQLLRNPTLAEVKTFVQIMNENLVPISNFDEKINQAIAKLEELHVCTRMPGDVYTLWDKNPNMPSRSFMHAQTPGVRFDFTEAYNCGLNVGGMDNVQGLPSDSGAGSSAVLHETFKYAGGKLRGGEVKEMATTEMHEEAQAGSSDASADKGINEVNGTEETETHSNAEVQAGTGDASADEGVNEANIVEVYVDVEEQVEEWLEGDEDQQMGTNDTEINNDDEFQQELSDASTDEVENEAYADEDHEEGTLNEEQTDEQVQDLQDVRSELN